MQLDEDILRAALTHPDCGERHPDLDRVEAKLGVHSFPATWTPAPDDFLAWARSAPLPEALVAVMARGWPNKSCEIGAWTRLLGTDSLRQHELEHPLIASGFLAIGRTLCADIVLLDLQVQPGAIGYVERRTLREDAAARRAAFRTVSCSLGAFVLGVVKDAVPIDAAMTWSEENESGW